MSYDKNSYAGSIGDLGEAIFKNALEQQGFEVNKIKGEFKGSNASVVDFTVRQDGEFLFYAEVKTIAKKNPFGVEKAPCYGVPASRIDAYLNKGKNEGVDVRLYVVDPVDGVIRYESLFELEKPKYFDFRRFPEEKFSNYFGGFWRYYHQNSFPAGNTIPIAADALKNLRETAARYADNYKDFDTLETVDLLTAPNGTTIDVLKKDGDNKFYVKAARLHSAIGYSNTAMSEKSPLMKAATWLNVKWDRFNTRRLSGNEGYGTKAYYFNLADVPKILAQYVEFNAKADVVSIQAVRNKTALALRKYFLDTVIPKLLLPDTAADTPAFLIENKILWYIPQYFTPNGIALDYNALLLFDVYLDDVFNKSFEIRGINGRYILHTDLKIGFFTNALRRLWGDSFLDEINTLWAELMATAAFLKKYFGIDLFANEVALKERLDAATNEFHNRPYWARLKALSGICKIKHIDVEDFKNALHENLNNRRNTIEEQIRANFGNDITIEEVAHVDSEIIVPNKMRLPLFTTTISDKTFVKAAQIAGAIGYDPSNGGIASDGGAFGQAVNCVAPFFYIGVKSRANKKRFIAIEDVPAVLQEFSLNHVYDEEHYLAAEELLTFWREKFGTKLQ